MDGERGFTLVELLVVFLIIGIVALIAVPQYTKTIETSKAEDALSIVQMIATTNRMRALDNPGIGAFLIGVLDNTCNTRCCQGDPGCTAAAQAAGGCILVACRYLANQEFDAKPYVFQALDPNAPSSNPCGLAGVTGNFVACTKRKSGPPPGTDSLSYQSWGYTVDRNGQVQAYSSTLDRPPLPS